MTLLNAADFCEGSITRERTANNKSEKSIIDFVVVCQKIYPFVSKFIIDEKHIYTLSNYSGKKIIQSDHNSLITKINLRTQKTRPERRTVFNFNDNEGMEKFKYLTSKTNKFTSIFDQNIPFDQNTNKWAKLLKRTVHLCFKKVRINKRHKRTKNYTFKKFKEAIEHGDFEDKSRYESILKEENAKENMHKVIENMKILNKNHKDRQKGIWKVKKIFPQN